MSAGHGRHREMGPGSAPEPALLPAGGRATAGEAAGRESAAQRVQKLFESPHGTWSCQGPFGPIPPGSMGTLAVRELSPGP